MGCVPIYYYYEITVGFTKASDLYYRFVQKNVHPFVTFWL